MKMQLNYQICSISSKDLFFVSGTNFQTKKKAKALINPEIKNVPAPNASFNGGNVAEAIQLALHNSVIAMATAWPLILLGNTSETTTHAIGPLVIWKISKKPQIGSNDNILSNTAKNSEVTKSQPI